MRLVEDVSFEGCRFEEDLVDGQQSRFIRNVVLLGPVSKKGYTYRAEAMQRALPLYNGARVFVNHPTAEEMKMHRRDVEKLAGQVINPVFKEGKIKADIEVLPDNVGLKFWNIAKFAPTAASFSHIADGEMSRDGKYVEDITAVHSVDLVTQGATTVSVFESATSGADSPASVAGRSRSEARSPGSQTLAAGPCVSLSDAHEAILNEPEPFRLNVDTFLAAKREGKSDAEALDLAHR